MHRKTLGFTLVELVVCVCLLGIIVLGFFAISSYSQHQLVSGHRRVVLQNEASLVLEHMTKNIIVAVGHMNDAPIINLGSTPPYWWFMLQTDRDKNGAIDSTGPSYRYFNATYEIQYNPVCPVSGCTGVGGAISKRVTSFDVHYDPPNRCVFIAIAFRFNPAQPSDGANPSMNVRTCVDMPSTSVN